MKNNKGVSLIVLIITIIVVIILSAVVILTLSKNNPIESAKEARFKEDVRTFQEELAMTVSKQYTQAGGHRDEKITTSDFDEIKEYIPSFSKKYKGKLCVENDELKYLIVADIEKQWCESLNIKPLLYIELEYLEVINNQANFEDNFSVDTDIKLNNNSRVEFKILYDKEGYGYFFTCGNYYADSELFIKLEINESSKLLGYYNQLKALSFNFSKTLSFPNVYTIIMDGRTLILNDVVEYNTNKLDSIECKTTCKIMNCSAKYYYFKIYDNNKLIRDYIPVLDKDRKPALYDKVDKKFYYFQGNGKVGKYELKK